MKQKHILSYKIMKIIMQKTNIEHYFSSGSNPRPISEQGSWDKNGELPFEEPNESDQHDENKEKNGRGDSLFSYTVLLWIYVWT
jgi:hypothetical protein